MTDPLLLTGVALVVAGLAFKASVAPFHQWTPDVYQGAPTPVTAFMAVATKVAAFAILLRFLDHALPDAQTQWAPWLAVLAVTTIVIGNVGAIAQDSLKRMLGWSGVAQAGYLLAGVVVGTRLGLQAVCFYLIAYLFMNVAAFAVVAARERVSEHGDGARVAARPGRRRSPAGVADDDRDAVAGRLPRHRRLHRQVLPRRRRRGRRLRLARHRDHGRLDDLAGLLPARAGGDVDGQLLDRAARACRRARSRPSRAGRPRATPAPSPSWCSWPCWRPRRPWCSASCRRRCSTCAATRARRSARCSRRICRLAGWPSDALVNPNTKGHRHEEGRLTHIRDAGRRRRRRCRDAGHRRAARRRGGPGRVLRPRWPRRTRCCSVA